jgi:dihydrolipoamide dehydrogenase
MSESIHETEVLVIGGGPGGYAAAFRAADLGRKVTLVDPDPQPGGVCLHRGCIPSKALLHAARLILETREAKDWGLKFRRPQIDLAALREWQQKVVGQLANGVAELCRRRGVEHVQGRATFEDSQTVRLTESEVSRIRFGHAILATGSRPATLPGLDLDTPRLMDSTSALALDEIPETLLVIGGGYIGLELGTVYAALGSRVTLVELTEGLLPGVDRDLVRPLQARLKGLFHAIHLKTKVVGMEETEAGLTVTLEGEGEAPVEPRQTFDRALVAVGRRPNSDGIGLENTGVEVDGRGFVVVDERQRTKDERFFAIGDVAGEPMLAHKATAEGKVVAEVLAGQAAVFDPRAIPAVVFTDPEVAWCGLTETEAKRQGRAVQVARFPWAASGRAATLGRSEGLTKLVLDPETGRVWGVGAVGVGVGELIAEAVLAVEMGAVAEDLAESIHAHPTLSETLQEGAEVFLGRATHLYRKV